MPGEDKGLFRKTSLEALDDKGEVREIVKVTRPSMIIVIIAMAVCCLVALCWLFFGKVNLKVTAYGVAFPHAQLQSQSLPFSGRVKQLGVTHGEYAAAGTPLMNVATETAQMTVMSENSGVVLDYKAVNEEFRANEPIVYMLPQDTSNLGREIIALVQFRDLRWLKIGQQVQVTPSDLTREDYGYAKGKITSIDPYPISEKEVQEKLKLSQFAANIFPEGSAYEVKVLLEGDRNHLKWSRKKSSHLRFPTGSFCQVQIITRRLRVYEVIIMKLRNKVYNIEDK